MPIESCVCSDSLRWRRPTTFIENATPGNSRAQNMASCQSV